MASYTWIGAAGGLYATTTNWSPTGLPTTGDDIVFTGDASPSVGTTARTIRNLTVNGGTVTFAGTGAFTIQGDISNAGTLNMNTFTTSFTGGTNQTLSLGTNSFTSCTINKTVGTRVTLNAAWNVTGTAAATLTVTAGDLYTQGYTVTCQLFAASGNTDRTIDLAGGAMYVTGTSGTLWNTSHTTATGTAWTKFARSGAAYIQPSGGTTATITGGGIASNYTAGATFNGVPPTFQLGNNKTYTTTGQFENLEVNGNFAGTSTPQIWGNLTGSPVSYNNVTTCNPVIIGRTGVTNTVSWRAQVTSYVTQNPLSGTPTFTFDYARAVTFTLTTNTSTYNLWIDGNDTTGAAWQTAAFTVTCNGNSSTYNENIIRSTSTLTYSGQGTGSTYNHYSFYDNSTTSAYTLAGNAATVHNIYSSFNTIGTVTFNFGTLTLQNTSMYCRIFSSAPTTTSQARTFNFQGYWIYINGNHRAGTNGAGTLTITSATTTTCSSDSDTQGGGFWLQTTGACATGLWSDAKALRYRIEALGGVTLNASISASNLRSIEFFGPVNFASAQTVNLINNNCTIYWNESGAAFNLTNLTATIACATGGTFDILRNGSSGGNANWRLGTLSTLTTSLADNQTVTILGYVRTLSLTKNTGTFNLDDLDFAQTITCSGGVDTNYYYNYVRTSNPFTTTWTPITGAAVNAAVTATQVGVKSTSGSGSGASFNVTKAVNQTTYASATITVAALGSGYVVGDTITLSGANLGGADGTNDLTFTITAATQATLSGTSDGARLSTITGTAVNTAQTRTNVPVKSTNGSGTGALFSVTKTGTGVVYVGVTTIIRTTDGSGYNYGDTIVLSGSQLGGVDGTNDLTFTFGQATEHYVTGGNDFTCKNILDHTAGDLEIGASRTMYCRTFQSTSTTNIRNWRWNGWIETSGTGLVSIGSAGANIRGNFFDTYSGGFRAIGTGANAFGTNVTVNAPRVYLGTNTGYAITYTSVNGNISHLIFYNNDYTFTSASGPTVYGNCSFNYYFLQGYGTWTNLTVNWQPLRNGADLQLYNGWNWQFYGLSPTIPAITLNTPLGIADAGATITIGVKCNTFTSTTTHNYTVNTAGAGLQVGTSISITGNNCTFNFNTIGSHYTVANPTFTLGASTSTNNFYNIGVGYYFGPQLDSVDFIQLGGTTTFLSATTIRDYTFTGPGILNLSPNYLTFRNFSSSNSNARTLNFNNISHSLTGVPTISTGTNLVVQNPGGFTVSGSGTINLSGLSAAADNNFNITWQTACTFTSASAVRNLYIYSGAALSTTSAITVNVRGTVTSPDGTGGTGPFTGMTISFPLVGNPEALNQEYNVITPTVIPSVTVLGSCTISGIRTTTLTLSPSGNFTSILTCQGNSFVDASLNNLILTVYGNVSVQSLSPFSQPSGSNYFDGNGDYFTVPYSERFNLSSGDWTMEAWFNASSFASGMHIIAKDTYGVNFDWSMLIGSATSIALYTQGTNVNLTVTVPTMSVGVWYHVAFVRSGTTNTIYLNGIAYGSNTMTISNDSLTTPTIGCASFNNPNGFMNGYISNLRIVKGAALYTARFTPPTIPLTSLINTITFNASGHVTTLTCTGSNGSIITLNLAGLITIPTTVPFTGGATYNLNGLTASSTSVSCGGTTGAVYNISSLDLSGTTTSNHLVFDGAGNLNLTGTISVGRFTATNTVISRTLNFNTYNIQLKQNGVLNYNGTSIIVTTTSLKNWMAGPGRIYLLDSGCSLTTTSVNENSALNIQWGGAFSATTVGTSTWRNFWSSAGYGQDGIGSHGWLTNSSPTINVYGDLRINAEYSGGLSGWPPQLIQATTYWTTATFNIIGTTGYQFITHNDIYAHGYIGTVNLNGNSAVVFGSLDYGLHHGSNAIRTINVNTNPVIIFQDGFLMNDSINFGSNPVNIYTYNHTIYTKRWNCPNSSNFNWRGEGTLDTSSGIGIPWGGNYYDELAAYGSFLYRHGDTTPGGVGPRLTLNNTDAIPPYKTTVIGNLYWSDPGDQGQRSFNINRSITYYNGSFPSTVTTSYGFILNSGASTGGFYTISGSPDALNVSSTTNNYCSVLWWLPSSGVYYFELTTVNTGSSTLTVGIQSIPNRLGPSATSYGSGTTATGNNPVFNITSTTFQTAGGPRYVIIDCDAKTVRWNTATTTSWSGIGTNPGFFGIYDNSTTGYFSVNINWGSTSGGTPSWTLATSSGYTPITNINSGPSTFNYVGNMINLQSINNMTNPTAFPGIVNSTIQELEIEIESGSIITSAITLSNAYSKFNSSGKNIITGNIISNSSIELGNSIVTLTGNNTVLSTSVYNSNNNFVQNYVTKFGAAWSYCYINSNVINLNNSTFTIECWIRPNESVCQGVYDAGMAAQSVNNQPNFNVINRGSIVLRGDYNSLTPNWDLFLSAFTGNLCFQSGSTLYDSGSSPLAYKWNHVAAVYDLTDLSLYINGIRVLKTAISTVSHTNNIGVYIGFNYSGYMSNLRIVKGSVLYTGNTTTIPTQKLTNVGNTLLLMFINNNNNDASTSPKTVSVGGSLTRYLGYPYGSNNFSEIIVTGTGDKNIEVIDSNLYIITNNSQFTHSGNGEGTGWLNLINYSSQTLINTVRTGSGNFSKGFKTTDGIQYVIVAGGGSGGNGPGWEGAGGGGAGGVISGKLLFSLGTTYNFTVGAGGAVPASTSKGNNGTNSSITGTGISAIAVSGGGGGSYGVPGNSGGSGGGGGAAVNNTGAGGGAGTPGQGYDAGDASVYNWGGGGGGAGSLGWNAPGVDFNNGHRVASNAADVSRGGDAVLYFGRTLAGGGGGGAGSYYGNGNPNAGPGGAGGSFANVTVGGKGAGDMNAPYGAAVGNSPATNGLDNTGSGGGGACRGLLNAGKGGSGTILIKIANNYGITFSAGAVFTTNTTPIGDTVYEITGGTGTFSIQLA